MEKLDSFSKIIVATSAINYMANSLSTVNQQMKMIPDEKGYHADGIKQKDELLNSVVNKLGDIMEELGNCINNCDAICPIDERVTSEAFAIILHGKDDVES